MGRFFRSLDVARDFLRAQQTLPTDLEEKVRATFDVRASRPWDWFAEHVLLWQMVSELPAPPGGQFAAVAVGPPFATNKRRTLNIVLGWRSSQALSPCVVQIPLVNPPYVSSQLAYALDDRWGPPGGVLPFQTFSTGAGQGEATATRGVIQGISTALAPASQQWPLLPGRVFKEGQSAVASLLEQDWLVFITTAALTANRVEIHGALVFVD
jgi:hypothetical protein